MSRFYTASGDQGTTDTLGKSKVSKNDLRIRAVGAVDEATESLGFARAVSEDTDLNELVKDIQSDLIRIMSLLVVEEPDPDRFPDIEISRVEKLEEWISNYEKEISPPEGFIIPGDSVASSAFGMARTIIRRAEREIVNLKDNGLLFSEITLPYLNRLSSLCYVLELKTSEIPPTKAG